MFKRLRINKTISKENIEKIKAEYVNAYNKLKKIYVQIEKLMADYKDDISVEILKMLIAEELCSTREKQEKMRMIEQKYNVGFKSEQKGLVSSSSHYMYNTDVIKKLLFNSKQRSMNEICQKYKYTYDLQIVKLRYKLIELIQKIERKEEIQEKLIIDMLDELVKNYTRIADLQILVFIKNN